MCSTGLHNVELAYVIFQLTILIPPENNHHHHNNIQARFYEKRITNYYIIAVHPSFEDITGPSYLTDSGQTR